MTAKVVLNCQHTGLLSTGGVGRYADNLRTALTRYSGREFETQIVGTSNDTQKPAYRNQLYGSLKQVLPPFTVDLLNKLRNKKSNSTTVTNLNEGFSTNDGPVLLHEVSNYRFHEGIASLLGKSNFKYVCSFLDLQEFYYPGFFPESEVSRRRVLYSFFREHCDHFFAISEFTKQSMVDYLGISPDRITVTYLGANLDGMIANSKADLPKESGNYFVYPAKPWVHKNHASLLKVISRLQSRFREQKTNMVLCGGFSESEKHRIMDQARQLGIDDLIKILGFLTEADLQSTIAGARAMVFPSLFEGFGMPVVEAQALGCPVISSVAGSLKEICMDSALTFDPSDLDEMEKAVDDALSPSFDAESWRRLGFENARRFTWESCTNTTISSYKKILQV